MATLYEINAAILDCVDMETGEIIDVEKLNELQMSFDTKVEGIACWIKNLISDAEAIKAERDSLMKREQSYKNKAESLKKYLQGVLDGQKFKTAKVSISYRKSDSVEIAEGAVIPPEYLKFSEPEVRKADIKQAIKAGMEFEGVCLVEKQNIQIR